MKQVSRESQGRIRELEKQGKDVEVGKQRLNKHETKQAESILPKIQ